MSIKRAIKATALWLLVIAIVMTWGWAVGRYNSRLIFVSPVLLVVAVMSWLACYGFMGGQR